MALDLGEEGAFDVDFAATAEGSRFLPNPRALAAGDKAAEVELI